MFRIAIPRAKKHPKLSPDERAFLNRLDRLNEEKIKQFTTREFSPTSRSSIRSILEPIFVNGGTRKANRRLRSGRTGHRKPLARKSPLIGMGSYVCGGQDCKPVEAVVLPDGSYYLPTTNELFPPTWQHHRLMIASIIVPIIQWQTTMHPGATQYGKAHPRLDASLLQ